MVRWKTPPRPHAAARRTVPARHTHAELSARSQPTPMLGFAWPHGHSWPHPWGHTGLGGAKARRFHGCRYKSCVFQPSPSGLGNMTYLTGPAINCLLLHDSKYLKGGRGVEPVGPSSCSSPSRSPGLDRELRRCRPCRHWVILQFAFTLSLRTVSVSWGDVVARRATARGA